jgi:hypothetical protein
MRSEFILLAGEADEGFFAEWIDSYCGLLWEHLVLDLL